MKAAVKVVGMIAGHREHVVAQVDYDDPVLLVPEPKNEFDPNAIAVYTIPRGMLEHPDALVSSLRDPDHVGTVHEWDRMQMMDRQAGYVPAAVAANLSLPERGVVGFVSQVRHAPTEYGPDGGPLPDRVAGFDVTAFLVRR